MVWAASERFADYSQWDAWQSQQQKARNAAAKSEAAREKGSPGANGKAKQANPNPDGASPAAKAAKQAKPVAPVTVSLSKKKLSFTEVREFETIEHRIAETERELEAQVASLGDPAVTSDAALLRATTLRIDELHRAIESLYTRWAELEQKKA